MHIVINADDPLLSRLKLTHKGKITTYGMDEIVSDKKETTLKSIDFAYCPVCNNKFGYNIILLHALLYMLSFSGYDSTYHLIYP